MADHLQLSEVSAAQQRQRRRLFYSSVLFHNSAGRTASDVPAVSPRQSTCWPAPSSTPTVRRLLPAILLPAPQKQRFGNIPKRTLSIDSIDSLDESFRRVNMDAQVPPSPSPIVPSSPPKSPPLPSTIVDEKSPVPGRKCSTPTLAAVGRSKTDPGGSENESSGADLLSPTSASKPTGKVSEGSQQPLAQKRSSPDMRFANAPSTSSAIAKREIARTKTLPQQETLADLVGLSPYQQKLMLQTWPNIYGTGSASFGLSVYNALCNNNNNAKTLMQKANSVAVFTQSGTDCTASHAKLTLDLLDTIVRNLDGHSDLILNHLRSVGACHRPLKAEGLRTQVWEDLGDALRATIRKHEPVRKHKELGRAWLALVSFIIDNLKQGQDAARGIFPSGPASPSAE
uniref:Globin family profile domain-containing protein n=1 Tax=Plectus sambesii TaxID=2011161 RepID=A0A914VEX0_9BILA